MGFAEAIKTCFRKYVTFSGRAPRPEYWWFVLFVFAAGLVFAVLDSVVFGVGTPEEPATAIFQPAFSLATFLPLLAAAWRRMHDTGRPGWYLLIPLGVGIALISAVLLGAAVSGVEAVEDGAPPAAAAPFAGIAFVLAWGAYLAALALVLFWLTRPGEPGPNAHGPPPRPAT